MKSLRLMLFVITALAAAVPIVSADIELVGPGTQRCILGRRECFLKTEPTHILDAIVTANDCDLGFVTCLRRLVIGR